jgi:hypothetical protein
MTDFRAHSELPGSFASLWWAKHEGETYLDGAVPVLLKAIRWMAQFLPNDDKVRSLGINGLVEYFYELNNNCLMH